MAEYTDAKSSCTSGFISVASRFDVMQRFCISWQQMRVRSTSGSGRSPMAKSQSLILRSQYVKTSENADCTACAWTTTSSALLVMALNEEAIDETVGHGSDRGRARIKKKKRPEQTRNRPARIASGNRKLRSSKMGLRG